VDVKRKKIAAERNPLRYLLFVCYFPVVLQGPVVRYREISESLFSEWLTEFTKKANEAHAMILQNHLALENYDRLLETEGHAIAENPFHPERCTRPIIDALIESIFVGKRISGTRTVPIEIHWNF
jgi:hypothetical protein